MHMSDQKELPSVGPWSLIFLGAGGLATVIWAVVLVYGAWNLLLKPFS
jgi:hypothetical protein